AAWGCVQPFNRSTGSTGSTVEFVESTESAEPAESVEPLNRRAWVGDAVSWMPFRHRTGVRLLCCPQPGLSVDNTPVGPADCRRRVVPSDSTSTHPTDPIPVRYLEPMRWIPCQQHRTRAKRSI